MNWLFPEGLPLPAGLSLEALQPAADALGDQRLDGAEELLGRESARALAKRAGPYLLEEGLALKLGLEGLELGKEGEVEALTPARWGRHPEALSWEQLRARLADSGGEARGLMLSKEQAAAFLRFLSRQRIDAEEGPPEKFLDLARHFFFGKPLNVVVRYTGPVSRDS